MWQVAGQVCGGKTVSLVTWAEERAKLGFKENIHNKG